MAPTIRQLKKMTDKQIEEGYDSAAKNTVVGTQFWQDELVRREQRKQTTLLIALTIVLIILTAVIAGLTVVLVMKGV